jgi:hypothetical protein
VRIVLLEDDYLWVQDTISLLRKDLRQTEFVTIRTEYEFRTRIKELIAWKPDLFILDMMVRWTDPRPKMPMPPKEIGDEGHYKAGLRCARLLRAEGYKTRLIFLTVLDRDDLHLHEDLGVVCVTKTSELSGLVSAIKTVVCESH